MTYTINYKGKQIDLERLPNGKFKKPEFLKKLEGSYGGSQVKPAVEVIIVVMKPTTAGSYINQALENGKGITWLDDCRIPYKDENEHVVKYNKYSTGEYKSDNSNSIFKGNQVNIDINGRFPANLLVSDDVLDDGRNDKGGKPYYDDRIVENQNKFFGTTTAKAYGPIQINDSGSYSRYFSLDAWAEKNLPFLIVPKASKREKNEGLDINPNKHPTVKPIKLMSYLITLGSRPGDTILDPFAGSFTTCCAAILLNRKFIGIEKEPEYFEIGKNRLEYYLNLVKNKPLEI